MRLIVLGKNSDDRGTQLETLSSELLTSLKYTRVATNVANEAGELDITAEFVTPLPVENRVDKVIGECKALKAPLATPDWLKFLGKLYVETRSNESVNGVLIALSGVNGNVQGSIDTLKLKNVRVIGSSTLIEYLGQSHGLAPQAKVNDYLSTTGLTHSAIFLAYYNRRVYWVITYDAGRYTVMAADVSYPDQAELDVIRPLVEGDLEAKTWVDLREAKERHEQAEVAYKYALALAMTCDGRATEAETRLLYADVQRSHGVSDDLLNAAVAALKNEGVFVRADDRIDFTPEAVSDPAKRADIFRKYLQRVFLLAGIGSDWWDRNIDTTLLEHIIQIQVGLRLPDADKEKAISLMRLSPSALAYGLKQDGMIVHKYTGEPKVQQEDERMIEHDRARFMRELYTGLSNDFGNPWLARYFFELRRIDAMERQTSIVLTDREEQVVISDTVKAALVIGELDKKDSQGNSIYIHVSPVANFREIKREKARQSDEKKKPESGSADVRADERRSDDDENRNNGVNGE